MVVRIEDKLYHYHAIVVSVYDGDTCTVNIDLGFGVMLHGEKIRLARIDAPELRGETHEAGEKAKDFLRNLIDGKEILLQTKKDKQEKYCRYVAEIFINDENINDKMVASGNAVYKDYSN